MRRFPSMKVAFASILSCLVLLLGMFATTGTASANSTIHPFINLSDLSRFGDCVSFRLDGGDFTPNHHVDLFANGGANIRPGRVRADGNGNFSVLATACANQAFSSCGSFIESFNFCGFILPQQDFCGVSGFDCSGFFGSAMEPAQCNPQMQNCTPPPCIPNVPSNPMCHHMRHGHNGPNGNNGSNGNNGPNGPMGPPFNCHPGQTCCQPFSNFPQCRIPGHHFPPHPRFRFHRVSVFDFCRFHFHQSFPFCFRFFPREFVISILITARDEHTGKRAHAFISAGGF
jgi:hypothetical protein